MLIRRPADIRSSEITDEQVYLRRREFMRLAATGALATAAGSLLSACGGDEAVEAAPAPMGQSPLANVKPKVVSTDEKLNTFEEITSYNNFYEFGTGKNDPQRHAGYLKTSPWIGEDRRALQQAGDVSARRSDQAASARGAHLSAALRRGLVDGDPVDRHSAQARS